MQHLVLFPTQREFDACVPTLSHRADDNKVRFQVCGFGPIAAGIETARLVERYRPARILLVGIAGSYDGHTELGTAFMFDQVACDAVGVGGGNQFQTAEKIGWMQWPGDSESDPIGDQVELAHVNSAGHLLLTVGSASVDSKQADGRRERWPAAIAEDMEGFAVAMAGRRANTPVSIIRGISNLAGNRDHANWQIDQALQGASELATEFLGTKS